MGKNQKDQVVDEVKYSLKADTEIFTVKLETTLEDILKLLKIDRNTIVQKAKNENITIKEAIENTVFPLNSPTRTTNKFKKDRSKTYIIDGIEDTIKGHANRYNIKENTVRSRIYNQNMSVEEAFKTPLFEPGITRVKLYTVDGIEDTLKNHAKRYGINPGTVRNRMNYQNMSIEEALTKPTVDLAVNNTKLHKVNGVEDSIKGHAKRYGLKVGSIRNRMCRNGETVEEAIKNMLINKTLKKDTIHIVDGVEDTLKNHAKNFNMNMQTLWLEMQNKNITLEEAIKLRKEKLYVVDGVEDTLAGHSRRHNINKGTVYMRVRNGVPIEDAFKSVRSKSKHIVDGIEDSIKNHSKRYNISESSIRKEMKNNNLTAEEAIKRLKNKK